MAKTYDTSLLASATKIGLAPKLSGNTAQFLRGDGVYATPPAPDPLQLDLRDDFVRAGASVFGDGDWVVVPGSTGTLAFPDGEAGHPGIISLPTGANANDFRIHVANGATTPKPFIPTDVERFAWVVRVPTVTSILVQLGIMASAVAGAGGGTNAVIFQLNTAVNGNWRGNTKAGGTETSTDLGVTVTAGNWYLLEAARKANGDWEFWVNGVLKATNTTNKPTAALKLAKHVETLTTASRQIDVDYLRIKSAITQRWT